MNERTKIIQLDERFSYTGEPTVQAVVLWGPRNRPCYETLSKEASASPAYEYIKAIQPVPGRTIVLIIGLGSFEWYGLNRNGDGFNEQPYKVGQQPTCGCCIDKNREAWITEEECVTRHYKSYEQGHVFMHHCNQNPKRAVGKVLKAFWNSYMHRVEVLEDIDNNKAPEIVSRIADGELLAKSMGCFVSGTLISTENGLEAIENVTPGTHVLTLKGHYKTVKSTHTRAYNKPVYVIRTATGISVATEEHPYAVLRKKTVQEKTPQGQWRRKEADQITLDQIEWVHAGCLTTDDFLVTPINTAVKDTLSVDECRLLGYYIADGCVIFRNGQPYGICWTHSASGEATTELPLLLGRLFPETTVHQRPHPESTESIITECYNAHLATLCHTHCGHLAHTKQLSLELMQQNQTQQLSFLGAWINCDGGNCKTGNFYISSCNKSLINQARYMGFRWGLYSRLNTIPHKPSPKVKQSTTEYRADFSRRSSDLIANYSVKVSTYTCKGTNTGPFLIKGAVVAKIKEIGQLEFSGTVYNLELDDETDPSYVAEGHAVHNCRIKYDVCTKCGHRAPTRQQYCDHLKWEMGQLDPQTGIRYGALNPSPRFFDSSWVVRPADRTGYMLKKVAMAYELQPLDSSRAGELIDTLHAKAAAARKLAVIDKVVRGYPAAMVQSELPEAPLVEQYRKTSLPGIVANTPELNSTDIQTLSTHQLPPLLSALSRAGIILTTPEFIRLFMAKAAPGIEIPDDVLENITALQSEFFDLLNQRPSLLHELTQTLSSGTPATEAIQNSVTPLLEKRSTISDYLSRRFTPAALKYDESPNTELLQITNPNTGQQYQTNRGAVRDAEDAMAKSQIGKLVGSAGLMAAAYKTMAGVPGIHPLWSLPLGVGALAMGRSGLSPRRGYQTQTGEEIPYITELREKRSGVMDVTTALGMDYRITKTAAPLIDRVLKRVHSTQPLYLLLQKNASWGLCASNLSLNDWATQSEKAASDGLTEPPIDLDKLAHIIGTLVWEVP